LNTPARLGILKALVPGDKVLPSFDYRLGVSQKEARRHCKVLEEHKLIRRYRRKAWGVSKEKQEYAYSLTELGRACLEYYGVVL
ncbi:MAG: helix-turn-helix domain-containing protein, partial [Candidatus Altiarchaeota archaeon]|nr:helix-turn-helix domain-containing protein [Candidatus Altiarchaeota archaeon]